MYELNEIDEIRGRPEEEQQGAGVPCCWCHKPGDGQQWVAADGTTFASCSAQHAQAQRRRLERRLAVHGNV
jgi:hypothetical protein